MQIIFGDGITSTDSNKEREFREFLNKTKISHDITALDFNAGFIHERREKHRHTLQTNQGLEEFVSDSKGWTPGEDDALNLEMIHEMLVQDKDPKAVPNFILSKAKDCGLTMRPVESLPKPEDDVLMAMAFLADDIELIKTTTKAEFISKPMRGSLFKIVALWEAVRDENMPMAKELVRLGAQCTAKCHGNTHQTIEEYCRDAEMGVSDTMRDFILMMAANETARRVLSEFSDEKSRPALALI